MSANKNVFLLAGNLFQARAFFVERGISTESSQILLNSSQLRGINRPRIVLYGSWWECSDLSDIMERASTKRTILYQVPTR